ncbi:MAG: molybdenum cofactor biosynthesis protein [Candidatus Ruminococcus intestinipullorum]|nr:molybdenum cofactor biosynthesis protein [Candidatus Ruminococcus intestinipullorum]
MKAAIFTLDTEGYVAKKESQTGLVLKRMLEQIGYEVIAVRVIPRDQKVAASILKRVADDHSADLILTTGAVGYTQSDCAPDALSEVADRLLPGIPEAIRAYMLRYKKNAMLNRAVAGIRGTTVMLNLSEEVQMAQGSLEYILPELTQAVEMLNL